MWVYGNKVLLQSAKRNMSYSCAIILWMLRLSHPGQFPSFPDLYFFARFLPVCRQISNQIDQLWRLCFIPGLSEKEIAHSRGVHPYVSTVAAVIMITILKTKQSWDLYSGNCYIDKNSFYIETAATKLYVIHRSCWALAWVWSWQSNTVLLSFLRIPIFIERASLLLLWADP